MAEPNQDQDWTPRPDPTTLTTEALHREVSRLEELIESERRVFDEKLERQSVVIASTDQALRDNIAVQIEQVKAAMTAEEKIQAMRDESLNLARGDVNRRLAQMNELREQIAAERGLYLTREMYDEGHAPLKEQLSRLGSEISQLSSAFVTYGRFDDLKEVVAELQNRAASIEGRSRYSSSVTGWLIAGAGVVVAIFAIVISGSL